MKEINEGKKLDVFQKKQDLSQHGDHGENLKFQTDRWEERYPGPNHIQSMVYSVVQSTAWRRGAMKREES